MRLTTEAQAQSCFIFQFHPILNNSVISRWGALQYTCLFSFSVRFSTHCHTLSLEELDRICAAQICDKPHLPLLLLGGKMF